MDNSLNQKSQYPRWLLFAISALILLIGLGWLFSIKTGGSTSLIFGLSLFRFSSCILILILALGFIVLSYQEIKNPTISTPNINRILRHASGGLFLTILFFIGYISLGILLYPLNPKGHYFSIILKLEPFIFITLGLAVNYILWVILKSYPFNLKAFTIFLRKNQKQYISTSIVFLGFIAIWILISSTKLGIQPDLFWKVAGVPFLSFQLYLIVGYLIFLLVTTKYILNPIIRKIQINHSIIHLLIILMIWIIACITWQSTPQSKSVFAPGPYPPSFVLFPHSDAAVHDAGGAIMTLGLPVNNGMYTDKPAYMFFLGLLHLFFSDDQTRIIQFQTIFLALFPAILYLIGKELYDWNLGLFIAMIAIARGDNAITLVTRITTVSVKEMMSEMPLALSLALLCLLIIRYSKNPGHSIYPIAIGGMFGISILIRPHPLLFIPMFVIILFIMQWKNKFLLMKHFALFLFTILAVVAPISLSNIQHGRRPDFVEKIIMVIQRGDIGNNIAEEDSYREELNNQGVIPYPSINPADIPPENTGSIPEISLNNEGIIQNTATRLLSHIVHNEVAVILSLPSSFIFYDHDQTVSTPYWVEDPAWNGKLSDGQWFAILFGLLAISFGLAKFIAKGKLIGLIPFLVHLTINFSNSLARSSGGRFLVPMDWIIYIYYAVGLLEILTLITSGFGALSKVFSNARLSMTSPPKEMLKKGSPFSERLSIQLAGLGFFLIYGLALANMYLLIPIKYPVKYDISQVLKQNNAFSFAEETIPDLKGVLQNPEIHSVYGKALYPRFYKANEGEPSMNSSLFKKPFDRLTFELISPEGILNVYIPGNVKGKKLVNGSSVLILGCQRDIDKFEAQYVIIFGNDENNILIRKGDQPYICNY
jgi:hypothetical protein